MSVVAVYNMKGGVGKTTTAVNVAYLAAAGGVRTLLWDLDPQGASSFAFRIRPRVAGFGRRSLESGHALADAIKETDFQNLDLLPADFAYRKLDRLIGHIGKPERVVTSLVATLGRGYDLVILDCPPGFSLLIEGVLAAADVIMMPTIPTVLSLPTVARVVRWAERSALRSDMVMLLNMVDRRKHLHRRILEWSSGQSAFFLSAHVPYASVVEQMAVRRMPVNVLAPRDPAATAFTAVWAELQCRFGGRRQEKGERQSFLHAIETLIAQLETGAGEERRVVTRATGADRTFALAGDVNFVHRFDTAARDLERNGYVLELCEQASSWMVVLDHAARRNDTGKGATLQAQIDRAWARMILSGEMSPLTALESRLGPPALAEIEDVRAAIGGEEVRRIDSRVAPAAIASTPGAVSAASVTPIIRVAR